ncbi:MAG: hypothetical protein HY674_15250 [Chloroflexi bacterium]|nr:hypothetical protein [Chloroflexota bacterium]
MKNLPIFATLGALGLSLVSVSVYAADPVQPERPVNPTPPTVRPVRPQRPIIIGRAAKPEHPAPPEHARPALPDDVKVMIAAFQKAREDFLTLQREELKNAKDLTREERAVIREQLNAKRAEFIEQQMVNRKQIQERLKVLREAFKNDQGRPTSAAKDADRP